MHEPVSVVTSGISVVVPVLGRVKQTRRLLESLAISASGCPEPAEILLVDDSAPADAAQHRRHCAEFGARYLRGPEHVGAKRNLGVQMARHDLVLFTDSDCRAGSELLSRHAATLRTAPPSVAAVAGPTLVEHGNTQTYRAMTRSALLNGDLEMPLTGRSLPWATTSNLCVRRSAFAAVGGFPERSLTRVAGEDVELGLRLTGRGFRILADAGAVVVHDRDSSDSIRAVSRRLYGYGRSETWLALRHPARRVPRLNPIAMLAGVGTVAVLAGRRTGMRSLLAIPVAAGATVAARAWQRLRPNDGPAGAAEAITCAVLEHVFDLGSLIAAFQLRRPDLAFTGFSATTPEEGGHT
ncbi:glycosyltransferase family 2 protein [Actinoplanes sp. CA-054009]